MTEILPIHAPRPASARIKPEVSAREAAEKLEATFLAEMLKSAGFGEQENSFSGSIGEDQFASFQRQALAEAMVKRGGIGLAEAFFKVLTETTNETE